MKARLMNRILGITDSQATVVVGDPQSDSRAVGYKIPIQLIVSGFRRVQATSWTRGDLELALDIPASDADLDQLASMYVGASNKVEFMYGMENGFKSAEADRNNKIGLRSRSAMFAYLGTFQ